MTGAEGKNLLTSWRNGWGTSVFRPPPVFESLFLFLGALPCKTFAFFDINWPSAS